MSAHQPKRARQTKEVLNSVRKIERKDDSKLSELPGRFGNVCGVWKKLTEVTEIWEKCGFRSRCM